MVGPVHHAARSVDPDQPFTVRPMKGVVGDAVARPTLNLVLLGSFSALALALAAIGLYGVVSYSVRLRLSLVGLALGLPLSLVALHLLNAAALDGVSGYPGVGLPAVAAVVVVVVLATAVAATLAPAGRAAGVDPAGVLRRG